MTSSLSSDPLIHPALRDPTTFVDAEVSRDGRWLLYSVAHGDIRTDVWFKDLKAALQDAMAFKGRSMMRLWTVSCL